MNLDRLLEMIADDEDGIIDVAEVSRPRAVTEDELLIQSFEEINSFYEANGKEPENNFSDMQQFKLYSRLQGFREDYDKISQLKKYDRFNLLTSKGEVCDPEESYKIPENLDDILADDNLGILDNEEDIFSFVHTPKELERAQSDFVAKRKPCKDFDQYESSFKSVHRDLSEGRRKLIPFREDNLVEGNFYVHNGVMFLLEKIDISQEEQTFKSGKRVRKDGRTRCIFENGTESNLLYRSVAKNLYANGKAVTENCEKVNDDFLKKFNSVTDEDTATGYIYILKSLSKNPEIAVLDDLYKIGFTRGSVKDRIKDAKNEPTYLMANVHLICEFECYNMNPQKFEKILHKLFGHACLNIDVFDENGKRHEPREWFIVPLEIIERAIKLIINGNILNYYYNTERKSLEIK